MKVLQFIDRLTLGFVLHFRLYKCLLIEFVPYFVAGVMVVLVFMGSNTILFNMLEHIISKEMPPEVYLRVLLLQVPTFFVMGLPMATMFGVLMSFGRLSQDGELDAMRTSRVVAWRILIFMIVIIGLPIMVLDNRLINTVVPKASAESISLWKKFIVKQISGKPANNVFFQGKPGTYFFIRTFDPGSGTLTGVTTYSITDETNPYPRLIVAPSGRWQEDYVFLYKGRIYDVKKDGMLSFDSTFGMMRFNVAREIEQVYGNTNNPINPGYVDPANPGKLTSADIQASKSLETDMLFNLSMDQSVEMLNAKIKMYKSLGVDTRSLETNMEFKKSIPFSCLVCILLTAPLSIGGARAKAGIMKSIVLVLLFMTAYYITTIVTIAMGHSGVLTPVAAAWAQNVTFAGIGALLALFYMRK